MNEFNKVGSRADVPTEYLQNYRAIDRKARKVDIESYSFASPTLYTYRSETQVDVGE